MNATDVLVMSVASYFVNMYFLGCLPSNSLWQPMCHRTRILASSCQGEAKKVSLWQAILHRVRSTPLALPKWICGAPASRLSWGTSHLAPLKSAYHKRKMTAIKAVIHRLSGKRDSDPRRRYADAFAITLPPAAVPPPLGGLLRSRPQNQPTINAKWQP